MKSKLWTFIVQISGGIVGGALGAVAGWISMATYGGRHGCWAFVDSLFQLRGYESCGLFGGWVGIFLGILAGLFFTSRAVGAKDPKAFPRFKKILLPLWVISIPVIFGSIYLKNAQEQARYMAVLEKKVQESMVESNWIDMEAPIEASILSQSAEGLEAVFSQGEDRLTVRLITGKAAEKWNPEIEEDAHVITYIYSSEWSPHLGLRMHFDYEKSSLGLPPGEATKRNILLAIRGLKMLEGDPRVPAAFESKVQELRNSLMVAATDGTMELGLRNNFSGTSEQALREVELSFSEKKLDATFARGESEVTIKFLKGGPRHPDFTPEPGVDAPYEFDYAILARDGYGMVMAYGGNAAMEEGWQRYLEIPEGFEINGDHRREDLFLAAEAIKTLEEKPEIAELFKWEIKDAKNSVAVTLEEVFGSDLQKNAST